MNIGRLFGVILCVLGIWQLNIATNSLGRIEALLITSFALMIECTSNIIDAIKKDK